MPGLPGAQGAPGKDGEKGADGQDGAPGKDGEQGIQGLTGADGLKGEPGEPGIQGPPGVDGQKGDAGEIGPEGPPGQTGETGLQGDKGETGETGAMGPPGSDGANGMDGSAGSAGQDGAPGTNGMDGVSPTLTATMPDDSTLIVNVNGTPFTLAVGAGGTGAGITIETANDLIAAAVCCNGAPTVSDIVDGMVTVTIPQTNSAATVFQIPVGSGTMGEQGIQGIQGPPGMDGVDGTGATLQTAVCGDVQNPNTTNASVDITFTSSSGDPVLLNLTGAKLDQLMSAFYGTGGGDTVTCVPRPDPDAAACQEYASLQVNGEEICALELHETKPNCIAGCVTGVSGEMSVIVTTDNSATYTVYWGVDDGNGDEETTAGVASGSTATFDYGSTAVNPRVTICLDDPCAEAVEFRLIGITRDMIDFSGVCNGVQFG